MAFAPGFRTLERILSGYSNINAEPKRLIPNPTINAWQTASCSSSLSPFAFALLTSVAVTLGSTETIQNAEEKTWLAAA